MGEKPAALSRDESAPVDPEETTQADTEWPVAAQYRVTPEPTIEGTIRDERGEMALVRRPRYRPSTATATIAAAVIAFLGLAAAAGAWLLTRDTARATSTTPPPASAARPTKSVPRVVGLTVDEARQVLDLRDLRAMVSGAAQAGSERVAFQDPAAGERVRRGTPVTLFLAGAGASSATSTIATQPTSESSPQANKIAVPSVVGLPIAEAQHKIRGSNLRFEVRLMPSARTVGTVLAQSPVAGAKLEPGRGIDLVVAKKVERPTEVRVPSLRGSSAAEAKTSLRELGLHWSVVEVASAESRGTVVGQTPAAGTELEKGKTVALRVSTGPALIAVPGVVGLEEQSARTELQNAGFEVTVNDDSTTDPADDGTVIEQDPVGGTRAERGAMVTISVARWTPSEDTTPSG